VDGGARVHSQIIGGQIVQSSHLVSGSLAIFHASCSAIVFEAQ
jgi:hypothetical protein